MKKWRMFVSLALLARPAAAGETEAKRPVPLYTNEDLERVRPFRDQTGVTSVPATSGEGASEGSPSGARGRRAPSRAGARGEDYWRAEARRVRERVRNLEAQAAELRRRLAEARSEPWSSRHRRAAPDTRAWEARLAAIEERRKALEDDLADRARQAGALPGWLR